MEMTVENICGLLVRSKLLTSEGVRSMYERWKSETKAAGNANEFGKWLVSRQYVTSYQSALLARGHGDGYFLGEYKILDRLGKGRMAGVYKAVHATGATVAIKVLPPSRVKDQQLFGRFQREARLALRLDHRHAVRSFDVGEDKGVHYIVMEYIDGETLEDVLTRRKQLPAPEGVRLVHQLLEGLQHIHEQGLVHRDLKPANMMLVPAAPRDTLQATLKILDIGLGRELFDESAPVEQNLELTGEGVLLGTPDYLAPEQARDAHSSDIRADIYSVGCVLYHLMTGQPPFPDTNIISQMVRHASETPKPMKELNPAVPEGLQLAVNFMLAKDPKQRYQTPDRAALALKPFMPPRSAPLYSLEADPRMSAYLKWLERGKPASVTPPAGLPPAALPVPPQAIPVSAAARSNVPVGMPLGSPPEESRMDKPRKKHKHRNLPVAKPVGGTPRFSSKDVDVELIPVAAASGKKKKRRLGLSGRDWVLLGTGGGIVIVVALAAFFLAPLLNPPAPEDDGANTPPPVVKDTEEEKTGDSKEAKKTDEASKTGKDDGKMKEKMAKEKEDMKAKEKMAKDKEKTKEKEKEKGKEKEKAKE